MPSRVPAAIAAVVATLESADLKVWNGPVVTGDFNDCVYIAYDGDPDGDAQAVEMSQEWAGIGAGKRDEEFDIVCAVWLQRGDPNVSAARQAAYDVLAVVENALRANKSLGLPPPSVAEITTADAFTPWDNENGTLEVRIVFRIHVKTRI